MKVLQNATLVLSLNAEQSSFKLFHLEIGKDAVVQIRALARVGIHQCFDVKGEVNPFFSLGASVNGNVIAARVDDIILGGINVRAC